MTIIYFLKSCDSVNPQLEKLLFDGINVQASLLRRMEPIQEFAIELTSAEHQIFGGTTGVTLYGNLYTDMLWIAPALRVSLR